MLPSDDCDGCTPAYLQRRHSTIVFSSLPFVLTFFIVGALASQKLFPLVSRSTSEKEHDGQGLPTHNYSFQPRKASRDGPIGRWMSRLSAKYLAALTFSANIALSAVLVELILCEISNSLSPAARSSALQLTLPLLLILLILVTPALELYSVIAAAGWTFVGAGKGRRRVAWLLESVGLAVWLLGFWYLGQALLSPYAHGTEHPGRHSFVEGCLERIGIIGISLMASLAGFAAVSALWQTWGVKSRLVTEADIARKQAGLAATDDMLLAKRSRLRALQRKLSETPQEGFMTRVIGSIRGNADVQERNSLQFEISGLETMRSSLSNTLLTLQTRRNAQLRSKTPVGRLIDVASYVFAIYCLYRIGATSITALRRLASPSDATFASTDPVTNILALITKHWDPTLDRAAWSRQISFLLSGAMLLASFNSALQTFLLFARLFPGLLQHTQSNLALLVSQVSATYVISSALLLRSNLPSEVGSVISDALGAPLEPGFVERWFEGWFLVASAGTAVGIWVGKKLGGREWEDDELGEGDGDLELGKRS